MEKFIEVASAADIEPGEAKLVHIQGTDVAIFNAAGVFYALENQCPKDGGPLSQGKLTGSMVECPLDRASFYLPTGEGLDPLTLRWVTTYRIRIDVDIIRIALKQKKKPARVLTGQPGQDGFGRLNAI
jgi:3-phenylpropionate/trans-cinnamate dioxygenase ferredoxin subunit